MGKYWDQPSRDSIKFEDNVAEMSLEDFHKLHEYSSTIPTGTYVGKMWKALRGGLWYLVWYDVDPDPKMLAIKSRLIRFPDDLTFDQLVDVAKKRVGA